MCVVAGVILGVMAAGVNGPDPALLSAYILRGYHRHQLHGRCKRCS